MCKNADILMDRFIRCSCNIRNTGFGESGYSKASWEDVDDITEINAILFRMMVLRPLCIDIDLGKIFRVPILQIRIEPKRNVKSEILVQRPSEDGVNYWDAFDGQVERGDAQLEFISLFDWGESEPQKCEYYRVKISRFLRHKEFGGREGLVRRIDAESYYCEVPETD